MKKTIIVTIVILVISLGFQTVTRREPHNDIHLWMLNVGQGESILIQTPSGKYLLFDGGPGSAVLSELGEILPIWRRNLDVVVLSHPHADHLRGLIAVLGRYTVGEIWSSGSRYESSDYATWLHIITEKQLLLRNLAFPDVRTLGELEIKVLHPTTPVVGKIPKETHDGNLSLLVSSTQRSILLAGDLAEKHEREIISSCQKIGCNLSADILQVTHHGSASASSPAFLKQVSPLVALIPVGEGNKFKHPRAETLERLTQAHADIFRTDKDGRILAVISEGEITITTASGRSATYSQKPPPAPT